MGDVESVAGYWHCPVADEARRFFMLTTLKGLLATTRVPQGFLNAPPYFQAMVQREWEKLNGMTSVDDIVKKQKDFDDLLHTLDIVFGRLERRRLYTTAHKRVLLDTNIKWCGKVYTDIVVKRFHERVPQDEEDAGIQLRTWA